MFGSVSEFRFSPVSPQRQGAGVPVFRAVQKPGLTQPVGDTVSFRYTQPVRFGQTPPALDKELSPKGIFNELRKRVIGQDESVKLASLALYKHIIRILDSKNGFAGAERVDAPEAPAPVPQITREAIQAELEKYYQSPSMSNLAYLITEAFHGMDLTNTAALPAMSKTWLTMFLQKGENEGVLQPTEKLFSLHKGLEGKEATPDGRISTEQVAKLLFKSFEGLAKMAQGIEEDLAAVRKGAGEAQKAQQTTEKVENEDATSGIEMQKSNMLLIGPSGVGKTHIIRNLKRVMEKYLGDVPFVVVDATDLTESGYVGLKVSDIARQLYEAAGRDLAKAERGIIFLDEIDKKAKPQVNDGSRDVAGEGAQNCLLPILEDGNVSFEVNRGGQSVTLNMKNVLVVTGGAFTGLDELVAKRLKGDKPAIGFNTASNAPKEYTFKELMARVMPEDLIGFGLRKELVGRIPVVATLNAMDVPTLARILTEPEDAMSKEYRKLFEKSGMNLAFEPEAVDAIAQKAFDLGTGARSLRHIMEKITRDALFNQDENAGKTVTITATDVKQAVAEE